MRERRRLLFQREAARPGGFSYREFPLQRQPLLTRRLRASAGVSSQTLACLEPLARLVRRQMAPPSAVLLRSPSGLKAGSPETEEEPWEQGAGFFSQPWLDKATPIPSACVPGPSVTSPSVLTESVKAFEAVQS